MTCAGTVEDPCYATMTFIANQDIFIYSTDYDPWGRNTPFNFTDGISSWKLERSWGSGWREIKLNESCMGTWCGAPDNKGGTYSFAFRKGKIYTIRLTAYKTNPNIDVKWSFTDELDPMWFGTNSFSNDKVSVKLISNTDNCFIDCEAEIEVCGKGNIPLKIDDKNFDLWFTDSKKKELARMSTNLKNSKLKNYDILIRENVTYIEDVPYYMECEDKNCTEIVNNKTNEATILCLPYNYSCVGGYNQEIKWKYEYKIYNPKNPSAIKELAKNECVNFKIKGKKSPQLGENNIDWKINLAGLEPDMAWWNSSFGYRKAINITNPDDETLMIYSTVNITEDTATLIDDGKMQADCDDLKIVYNDVTELNRTFLDDTFLGTTGGCDDAATVVFFMLQQNITAGAESLTDYYMYYGYASADNPKNNTMGIFIIYDDFNRATLGSAWQQKGTCSISANTLAVASNADACQRNFDVGGVVLKDFKWYWSSILTGGDGHNHFRSINVSVMESTLGYWEIRNSSYRDWMSIEAGGSHSIYSAVAAGTIIKQDNAVIYSSGNWYNITTVHTNSDGQFITTKNGLNIGWDTTNLTSTISDGQIIYGMRADFNRAAANLDNILVMRYQEVPPISTLGIEEEPPSPFQPTSISLLFNGTAANQTILYGSVLNISAKINVSGIPVSLYKNGTLINNGITLSENMTDINWFSNATYNITAVWVGNSSYGASNATLFIFVNKTNPTLKFRNVGISNNTVGNTTYSYVNSTVVFYAEWYSDNGVNYTSNDGLNYTILQTNETGTPVNHTYEWRDETFLISPRGAPCGGTAANMSILANGYYPSGGPKTDIFKFDPLGSHAWVNTGKDITSSTYGTICSGFVNDTTDYFYWFVQTNAGWYDPLTGNQGSLSAPPVSLSTGGCAIPYGPHEGIHILRDGHWIYFPKNDSYRIDLANSTWSVNWATCGLMKNAAGQDIMVVAGGVPDLNRTEIYNISENKWYNSTNVTIALGVLGAGRENVVFDNRLYLIYGMKQGGGDSYYNDIYEFNPERESWRTIITDGTGARDAIGISVIDDKIYALGGRDNSGALDEVQVLDLHHGSPKLMYNATTWKWANFTWSNHSIKTNGTVIEWKMCANNSLGNLACTNAQYFTLLGPVVTPTSINLLINGSSANQTITYGDILNISAKINVSGIPVSLYKNGTLFNNDITTSENMTNINWFANATYNITAAWAGNSTFGNSSATLFVFVNKASSTLTLALDGSSSTPQARTFSSSNTTDVQGNETQAGDSDCVYVLNRNGTSIPNGLHYLGVAGYNFTFSNVVCANYSANQVERMLTVNKATLTPTLALDGSAATPQTRTYDSSNTTNVQGNATATGDSNCVFGLKRNNTNIPNGQHYLGVGGYNFTFYGTSCTNYTNPAQLERMLTVNKASLVMTLVLDGSATTPQTRTYISTNATNIQGNETNSGDADCTYGLKRNGTNIPNGLHYLGVAGYNLTFYGESCSNYTNSQLERMLTVNKATPTFSTSVASPIIYETASDYTGSESNGGDGSCSYALKRNNVEIDTGSSVDDTTVLGVGSYNYTYYTDGCTNYTAAQDEETLAITKKTPGLSIVGISNGTYPDTDTIYWTSNDINGLTLIAQRNGSNIDAENNTAINLAAGMYNYTVSELGNANYSATSKTVWYYITKGTPSLTTSVTSPINYGNPSDYSGSESNTGDADCEYKLLVNNTQYATGSSVSDNRVLAAGGYNYTYYTAGGENWTFASSEKVLNVAKASPITSMTLTLDGSSDSPQTRIYDSINATNFQASNTITDTGCIFSAIKNGSDITEFEVTSYSKINITNFPQLTGHSFFGTGSEFIGDLDLDGVEDLAVGSPYTDDGGTDAGVFWIFFMQTNGSVKSSKKINKTDIPEILAGDVFGYAIANLGDLNGDGIQDLAVGSPNINNPPGQVWILFMNRSGFPTSYVNVSNSSSNLTFVNRVRFGCSLDNIGDLDLDGVVDIAVSSCADDDGGADTGAVYVIYLYSNGTVKNWAKINDTSFNDLLDVGGDFGKSISNIDDLNGDGIQDLVGGAYLADSSGGKAYIMFMARNGTVISYHEINDSVDLPTFSGTWFGSSAQLAGDMNADNIQDILVGQYGSADGGGETGAVNLLYMFNNGSVKSFKRINITDIPELKAGERFGSAIGIADLNGDGYNDLAVGASHSAEGGAAFTGAMWIIFTEYPNSSIIIQNMTNGLHYLGAGGYNFTYYTEGCSNYTAGQLERLLTVNKASLTNTLVLDGSAATPQTRTFISTNSTNVQGNNSNGGVADCTFGLKRNTTNIPNGQHFLGAGGYNFTFYGQGCSNYTSSQLERLLTVNKASGGLTLVLDGDATTPATRTFDPANTTNVQGNGTFSGDSGCSFGLKRNNTNIPNGLHYLGAAGYNFTFYLGGCSNYTNEQLERMLTVNKKSLTMTLVLDGSSATPQTRTFLSSNLTNIQGNQTGNTGDASCVFGLKRNTTNIPNGLHYLGAGGYNFTFYGESCANYTNAQLERLLTISKATSVLTLTLDGSSTTPQTRTWDGTNGTNVQGNETQSGDGDCIYSLYLNGTTKPNGIHYLGGGGYNWTFFNSACSNYTGATLERLLTVNPAASTCNLLINGTDGNVVHMDYAVTEFNATLTYVGAAQTLPLGIASNYSGWIEPNGASPLSNTTNLINLGIYNITGYINKTANVSACSETHYLTVSPNVTLEFNQTAGNRSYNFGDIINATGSYAGSNDITLFELYRNSTLKDSGNKTIIRLNDSLALNVTFDTETGGENNTVYIDVFKNSYVNNFYFNISGFYGYSSTKWNETLAAPTVHHVLVMSGSEASSTVTKTCSDAIAGAEHSHENKAPSVGGVLLWDTSSWHNTSYNWTAIYANYSAKGGVSGGGGSVDSSIRVGITCTPIADECEGITSLIPECSSIITESVSAVTGNYGVVTMSNMTPTQTNVVAIITNGGTAAGSSVQAYIKWETGSYVYLEMQNASYPQNVSIDVGADGDYDYQFLRELNQTVGVSPNRTVDLKTSIQNELITCTANSTGWCSIPIRINVGSLGTVELSAIEANITKKVINEITSLNAGEWNYTVSYTIGGASNHTTYWVTVYNISLNHSFYYWLGNISDEAYVQGDSGNRSINLNSSCGAVVSNFCIGSTAYDCLCMVSIGYNSVYPTRLFMKLNYSGFPNYLDFAQLCFKSVSPSEMCADSKFNQSAYYSFNDSWNRTNITWNYKPSIEPEILSYCYESEGMACFNVTDGIYDYDNISTISIVSFNSIAGDGSISAVAIGYNITTSVSGRPRFKANLTEFTIDAKSNNGTFTPLGQTSSWWAQQVCNIGFPSHTVNITVRLNNITNSTGDSVTSLPICMPTFLFSLNSTFERGIDANVTNSTTWILLTASLAPDSCQNIWNQIDFINCTAGDYYDFNFAYNATRI